MSMTDFELERKNLNRRLLYMTAIMVAVLVIGVVISIGIVRIFGDGAIGMLLCAAVFLGLGFGGDVVLKRMSFPEQEELDKREQFVNNISGFVQVPGAFPCMLRQEGPRSFELSVKKAEALRKKRCFSTAGPKLGVVFIVLFGLAMVLSPVVCMLNVDAIEAVMKTNDGDGALMATIFSEAVFGTLFIAVLAAFFAQMNQREPKVVDNRIEKTWIDQGGYFHFMSGYMMSNGEIRTESKIVRPGGMQVMIDRTSGKIKLFGFIATSNQGGQGYYGDSFADAGASPQSTKHKGFEYSMLDLEDHFEPSLADEFLLMG